MRSHLDHLLCVECSSATHVDSTAVSERVPRFQESNSTTSLQKTQAQEPDKAYLYISPGCTRS